MSMALLIPAVGSDRMLHNRASCKLFYVDTLEHHHKHPKGRYNTHHRSDSA